MDKKKFAFDKSNYILLLVSVAVIIIGFLLMTGPGSTETTFYTISVYFGAAGIQKTRYTIPAALFADFVGFFMASAAVRLLYRQ